MTHRARDRHRHSVGDRKQRLRRIERPFLEELEIRTLLTATLSDIGIVGRGNVTGLNSAVEVVGNISPPGGGAATMLSCSIRAEPSTTLETYRATLKPIATGISANGQVIGYSSRHLVPAAAPMIMHFWT